MRTINPIAEGGTLVAQIIEIGNLHIAELEVYARLTRAQLENRQHPQNGLLIAESAKVIEYALEAGYVPVSLLMERKKADSLQNTLLASCGDVPVYTAERELLAQLTGYALTRGVLCAMKRKPLPDMETVCRGARRIAVLEGIVDTTNMGAIFRSAAALHVDAVLLTGTCCDPLSRRSLRVSMGSVFKVPWTIMPRDAAWPETGMEKLREWGFKTAAMALSDHAVSVSDPRLKCEEKLAVILGTEGNGLGQETMALSDYTVKIPMSHGVDSLNVAAASAVAFWEMCGKRQEAAKA